MKEEKNIIKLIKLLYMTIFTEMMTFYLSCKEAKEINQTILQLIEINSSIINNLKKLNESSIFNILKNRKIINELRINNIDLLQKMLKVSNSKIVLDEYKMKIQENMKQNETYKKIMEKIDIDEYTSIKKIDFMQISNIVEVVKKETELYRLINTSFISALLGGIIGSIVTYIISIV